MTTSTAPQRQEIYVRLQGDDNEFVVVPTDALPENPYDLIYLLKVETAPRSCWRDVAAAYFRQNKWSSGIKVLEEATTDSVENVLRGGDEHQSASKPLSCSRLDLLASLAGAHIMSAAASNNPNQRTESLRLAADVFSRADKIDLDDPSIWTARGWAEFHASKHTAVNWFENARDKNIVLGAMGLAAIQLNRTKVTDAGKKDAITLLVSALRSNHCPPGVWTGLVYALFREGRMKAARNVARRAVLAVASSSIEERREALYLVALIESFDRNNASVETMTIALRDAYVECRGHEDSRILSLIAELHFNGGDFKTAERFGYQAVAAAENMLGASIGSMYAGIKNGVRSTALFQLSRAQHHLGKNDEAMHGFEQVKKLVADGDGLHVKANNGLYLRLGLLKLSTGRPSDEQVAQECLEKVVKEHDRCGIAKRALGVLLGRRVLVGLKKGRPRGGEHYHTATVLLKKGLEENEEAKKDVPAQLVNAGLLEESSPKVALDSYKQVVQTLQEQGQPVDPEIWNNMSSLMARLGRIPEAQELSLSKIEISYAKECGTIKYNRGRLAEMAGDIKKAEDIFRGIKSDEPHYHEAVTRLAVIAMLNSTRAEEAEQLLKESMGAPMTKSIAAAFLSKLYATQKKFKQAQEILEANRHECEYLGLSFSSFMHKFLDSLDPERKGRFLLNHIGAPLVSILKRNKHNSVAANGVGVFFAESKMFKEARDVFNNAGVGPLAAKTIKVNLAHTQVHLGHQAIKESARVTGRPSYKVVSNSRALFEQSVKLYGDALEISSPVGTKVQFTAHCELVLYSAWAEFEASQFRKSADMLMKLVHLAPSSAASWFNLGLALLESASMRAIKGKAILAEMQLAKDEFEGSRYAFIRSVTLARAGVDQISRLPVDRKLAGYFDRYARQQAKTHDVNLRNAINNAEDLEMQRKASLAILEERQKKVEEEKQKSMALKIKKEEELRKAFEESKVKREEYILRQAIEAKQEELSDEDVDDENQASVKKSKGKRKKKEPMLEEEKATKRAAKKQRKSSSKKKIDDSGSEYSDVGEPEANGENGTKRPYSDGSDEGDGARSAKRKRFALAVDEEVSDTDF